jgi:hypothetical protein
MINRYISSIVFSLLFALTTIIMKSLLKVDKSMKLTINYSFNTYKFVILSVSNNQGYKEQINLNITSVNIDLGIAYKFNNKT